MVTKTRGLEDVSCPSRSVSVAGYTRYTGCPVDLRLSQAIASSESRSVHTLQSNSGTIEYDVGRQKENYCLHTKDKFTFFSLAPVCYCKLAQSNGYIYSAGMAGPSTTPYPPPTPTVFDITEEMRKRAWAGIQPKLNTGFSLSNFLWEIKEIPRLMMQAYRLYRTLKRLSSLIRAAGGASDKTLAQLHLTYSYAIKPLVGDIKSLYDDLLNTQKRVNEFRDQGRTVQPYHYTEVVDDNVAVSKVLYYGTRYLQTKVTYHATLRASYTYPELNFFEGFARVMGLRLTSEVIWNAIPFSFLVDYVLRVGDFLAQFDVDPNIRINIHDYSDSIKSESTMYEVRTTAGTWWPDWDLYPTRAGSWDEKMWEWTKSSYLRQPGMPNVGVALPAWDELSLAELVLVGALARANLTN